VSRRSGRPVTKSPVLVLQPVDGNRRLVYNVPPGVDRIYIAGGTTADISKVRVVVDDGDVLDLSEFVPAEITPPKKIVLEWDPSEDNKTIQFLFGREYYKRAITYAEIVRSWDIAPKLDTILGQLDVKLSSRASESTLTTVSQKLDTLAPLTASDYDIISLDLSVTRTDALVASNVIFLKVLESTTQGATYTLKLFNPSKPGITQAVLPPGSAIERLRRANVYVSNPAQTGAWLYLFVFMG
jgi:uncharacterized protein YndB with AHSA1/START domain